MPLALTLMLLTIWAGAIFTFVNFDFSDERLWVPVFLALVGVFGSILPLVVAPVMALDPLFEFSSKISTSAG